MAEYKGIKGFQVQTRTDDPSPTEAQTGDFYYNSSTGQFKTIGTGGAPIGSWSSGGAMNTTRAANYYLLATSSESYSKKVVTVGSIGDDKAGTTV